MKVIDILKSTCDSLLVIVDEAEPMGLPDEFQDKLVSLNQILDDVKDNDNISRINELTESLKELSEEEQPDLYNSITLKIVSIILSKLALTLETEDWDGEFGLTSAYKIFELEDRYKAVNAKYTSRYDSNNPMLLMDCTNIQELDEFFNSESNITNLLLGFLGNLDLKKAYRKVLLGSSAIQNTASELESRVEFIRLYSVLQGKILFKPQEYQYNPVSLTVKYDPAIKYYQFADVISVMNEYNIHRNILDKYLRIYQVIENYMYKNQICKLCNELSYSKLSIRDFKNLSDKLANREIDALNGLLEGCETVQIDGQSLSEHVANKWASIIDSNVDLKHNTTLLMTKLGIPTRCPTCGVQTNSQILNLTGRILYKIRCSIVHDKINEYHITYDNLDRFTQQLLEEYLMPCMELIVYGLMFNRNPVVMYSQRELNLY